MNLYSKYRVALIGLITFQISVQAQLPDDPNQWVCKTQYSESELQQMGKDWCDKNLKKQDYDWRKNTDLPLEPGLITELDKKNNYDELLRQFLNEKSYKSWAHDQEWRLTGPYVGDIGNGDSYGVHPGVRIYYSPEVVKWMCEDRSKEIGAGAIIIKEMYDINPSLGVKTDINNCMSIPNSESLEPTSWTIMAKSKQSHDGWYWANPTPSGGNPPILDKSAFTQKSDVPTSPVSRNPDWYPTGYLFGQQLPNGNKKIFNTVYPYSLFGAACINCHASAADELTYSSLDNIVSAGLQYKHFSASKTSESKKPTPDQAVSAQVVKNQTTLHSQALTPIKTKKSTPVYQSPFSSPLNQSSDSFMKYYGDLGINDFSQAWHFSSIIIY